MLQENEIILQVYVGWDVNDARESIKDFGFGIRIIDEGIVIDNVINKMRINVVLKDNKIFEILGCY